MKLHLIGCRVFMRELYLLCARSPHSVVIHWMNTELHSAPQKELRPALQAEIDRIEESGEECDAILLTRPAVPIEHRPCQPENSAHHSARPRLHYPASGLARQVQRAV